MYLLGLPNRKAKQPQHNNRNKELVAEFENRKADTASVEIENKEALKAFKEEMKRLQTE
jgi:hypothetical protein